MLKKTTNIIYYLYLCSFWLELNIRLSLTVSTTKQKKLITKVNSNV